MKIFIDSADTLNIASCVRTGLVDGVTTNPTLIKKSGRNLIPMMFTKNLSLYIFLIFPWKSNQEIRVT